MGLPGGGSTPPGIFVHYGNRSAINGTSHDVVIPVIDIRLEALAELAGLLLGLLAGDLLELSERIPPGHAVLGPLAALLRRLEDLHDDIGLVDLAAVLSVHQALIAETVILHDGDIEELQVAVPQARDGVLLGLAEGPLELLVVAVADAVDLALQVAHQLDGALGHVVERAQDLGDLHHHGQVHQDRVVLDGDVEGGGGLVLSLLPNDIVLPGAGRAELGADAAAQLILDLLNLVQPGAVGELAGDVGDGVNGLGDDIERSVNSDVHDDSFLAYILCRLLGYYFGHPT